MLFCAIKRIKTRQSLAISSVFLDTCVFLVRMIIQRVIVFSLVVGRSTSYGIDTPKVYLFVKQLEVFNLNRLIVQRGKYRIKDDFKHFIYQFGYQFLDKFVWCANVGVIVYFNQPCPQVLVNQKIKSKKLKFFFLYVSQKPFLTIILFSTFTLKIVSTINALILSRIFINKLSGSSFPWAISSSFKQSNGIVFPCSCLEYYECFFC